MPFLHRSQSAAGRELKERHEKKDEAQPVRSPACQPTAEQRTSRTPERPKTAETRHRSFSRPRTATSTAERSTEIPIEIIQFRSGNDTFDFPTPSPRLPPKSATQPKFHVPPPLLPNSSPAIGVALGSPSQAPMPKWGRSYTANDAWDRRPGRPSVEPLAEMVSSAEEVYPKRPELKKKKSSWKSFGGLFGRKNSKSPAQEPFYKVKMPEQHSNVAARSLDTPSPLPSDKMQQRSKVHQRTPSLTRGMARLEARKEADLTQFHPSEGQVGKIRSPSMIQKDGFSPMFRALSTQRESQEMFSADRIDSPLSMSEKNGADGKAGTPRLDLDIPNPGFERYSIMFEKVLDDQKPSLLERRQSKLKRKNSPKGLGPVATITPPPNPTDQSRGAPQRSATSPGLRQRLSIRISRKDKAPTTAPPAAPQTTALHRPRPIQRSKTAPPGAQSPVAQAFINATKSVASQGLTPTSITFSVSENSLPPTPNTTHTAISDIAIINPNPTLIRKSLDQAEPSWDMMTSSAVAPFLSPSSGNQRHPRVKSPEELEKQIVQVSVARQVSVTKARRQVQHAIASKQPLRPRVVELGRDRERKSTVVVLETGDD